MERSIAEEEAEREVRARWDVDAELRNEFLNDYQSCVAFHRAQARGAVRILGSRVVSVKSPKAGE